MYKKNIINVHFVKPKKKLHSGKPINYLDTKNDNYISAKNFTLKSSGVQISNLLIWYG